MTIDVVYNYAEINADKSNPKNVSNGELRYSLRSVFKYLPFVRKIWIIMPNKSISFLDGTNDKITYVNDSQIVDGSTRNSTVKEWQMWKLLELGCSENIIYFNDDYFIGQPCTEDVFFNPTNGKPYVPIVFKTHQLNHNVIEMTKQKWHSRTTDDDFRRHTGNSHMIQRFNSIAFVSSLVPDGKLQWHMSRTFFHNACGVNLNDAKTLYDLMMQKYNHKEFIRSVERGRYDLQWQEAYWSYCYNVLGYKGKGFMFGFYEFPSWTLPKSLPTVFCINTSGTYPKLSTHDVIHFVREMEKHYPDPIKGEIATGSVTNQISESFTQSLTQSITQASTNPFTKSITRTLSQSSTNPFTQSITRTLSQSSVHPSTHPSVATSTYHRTKINELLSAFGWHD